MYSLRERDDADGCRICFQGAPRAPQISLIPVREVRRFRQRLKVAGTTNRAPLRLCDTLVLPAIFCFDLLFFASQACYEGACSGRGLGIALRFLASQRSVAMGTETHHALLRLCRSHPDRFQGYSPDSEGVNRGGGVHLNIEVFKDATTVLNESNSTL